MENNDFKRFFDIWKKADKTGLSQKIYSEKQIKEIKMKTSQDSSRSINNSILFDFIHKCILIAGMLLLTWFYKTNLLIILTLLTLTGLSMVFLYKEFSIRKKFNKIDDYTRELSMVIKTKLEFYRNKFTPLMLAFTNALLVWVGSMFYFFSKYGYYRMEDAGDIIVSLLMVSLAFIISYAGLSWQMKNNVLELQESLTDLDEQQGYALHQLLKSKKKNKMIMIIIASVGIFLFAVLLIIYLRQLY